MAYDTKLSAENEKRFKAWVDKQSTLRGRDMSQDTGDYDLRGYWVNGGFKDTGQGHMPDTYKKPNHPTFSSESMYNGTKDASGNVLQGGQWTSSGFVAGPTNKANMSREQMLQYFKKIEPGMNLVY